MLLGTLTLLSVGLAPVEQPPTFQPAIWGALVRVPEIEPAVHFYREALDFELAGFVGQESGLLSLGEFHLWLSRADGEARVPDEAGIVVNFQTADLEAAAARVEKAGGEAGEVRRFPLGTFLEAHDPWGNDFHLLHVPNGPSLNGATGIFNVGWDTESYDSSEPFLTSLGFRVHSRNYLPKALPYAASGAASLVTHANATRSAGAGARHNAVLLEVEDLDRAAEMLAVDSLSAIRPTAFGRVATLRSPAGLELRLVERSPAQEAFERFRSFAGVWRGESTKGWEARIEFEVIARGTTVVQRSNFAAHPGETMITAFHRDGHELVLTHYCVAGNQPHLVATEFDAEELAFEFRRGGNLASRDDGHMDAVRYRFPSADRLTAQWSWFQAGEERWMEEIRYERHGG